MNLDGSIDEIIEKIYEAIEPLTEKDELLPILNFSIETIKDIKNIPYHIKIEVKPDVGDYKIDRILREIRRIMKKQG